MIYIKFPCFLCCFLFLSPALYSNFVLHMKEDISDGIGVPDWRLALCLLLFWTGLFLTLAWGVKSSGKVRNLEA